MIIACYIDRDKYYQEKMEEQFEELAQLKDEKHRLLAIQDQLQQLHDRFQQVNLETVVVGDNQCCA